MAVAEEALEVRQAHPVGSAEDVPVRERHVEEDQDGHEREQPEAEEVRQDEAPAEPQPSDKVKFEIYGEKMIEKKESSIGGITM